MADNLNIDEGSGTTLAADLISGVYHPRVKVSLGADGSATDARGDSDMGMWVDPRQPISRTAVVPNTGNGTEYEAGDVVGDEMAFTDVGVDYISGLDYQRGVIIKSVVIVDGEGREPQLDLIITRASQSTVAADNSAFAPTDADLQMTMAVVEFGASDWFTCDATAAPNGNSVAHKQVDIAIGLPTAVDLYGVLVARSAFTPSADDEFTVILYAVQG